MKRQYIGSSDAAAVLGVDPWKTEEELVRRILYDEYPEVTDKQRERMDWGKRLEEPIIQAFTEKTGLGITSKQLQLFLPRHPFIGATVDGLTVDGHSVVEVKTALPFAGPMKKWTAGGGLVVPENYAAQVMHSMVVTGRRHAYVPVLFGLDRFEILELSWDEDFARDLLAAEVAFWTQKIEPYLEKERVA